MYTHTHTHTHTHNGILLIYKEQQNYVIWCHLQESRWNWRSS
jgi:hypothetical protein